MKTKFLVRNRFVLLGDLLIIIIAALGSFALRTDVGPLFAFYLPQALWLAGVSLIIKPLVFYGFGLYRRVWVYASTHELKLIIFAVTSASVLVSVTIVILRALNIIRYFPRSTLPIDWLLTLVMIGGFRFSMRLLQENQSTLNSRSGKTKRVLIVGAGDAGALVVREMQKNPQLGLKPICFLDDDKEKQKKVIYGVPVVGTLDDLARTVFIRYVKS